MRAWMAQRPATAGQIEHHPVGVLGRFGSTQRCSERVDRVDAHPGWRGRDRRWAEAANAPVPTSKSLKSDSIARSVIGLNSCEGMLTDDRSDFGYPDIFHVPLNLRTTAEAIGTM